MIFSKLTDDRLRISLSRPETTELFGSAERVDRNAPRIKAALKLLLRKAMCDRLIRPDILSVSVEIMRNLSGGYDIYFSKGRCSSGQFCPTRSVLEFSAIEDAIKASRALYALKTADQSSFYKVGRAYRLIISSKKDNSPAKEFADSISHCPLFIAVTEEHGQEIIKNGAVETLSKL